MYIALHTVTGKYLLLWHFSPSTQKICQSPNIYLLLEDFFFPTTEFCRIVENVGNILFKEKLLVEKPSHALRCLQAITEEST